MSTAPTPLAPSEVRTSPPALLPIVVLVAWTMFVWGGRVRNVLADQTLDGAGRTGPLLLSGSFVASALVVAVLALVDRRSDSNRFDAPLRVAVVVLAVWTTGVWVVRSIGIAVFGDHPVGFVAVHVVLGAVSIAVAVWAVRSIGSRSAKNPESA